MEWTWSLTVMLALKCLSVFAQKLTKAELCANSAAQCGATENIPLVMLVLFGLLTNQAIIIHSLHTEKSQKMTTLAVN